MDRFLAEDMALAMASMDFGSIARDLAELSEAWDNPELREEVSNRNYAGIHAYLQAHKGKVSSPLDFPQTCITGFEFAVWQEDWKMLALFFIHGADPDSNKFDGVLETHASSSGFGDPVYVEGFNAEDPRSIRGFGGLRLLNQGNEVGEAYLFIMECLHHGSISLSDQYQKLANCVSLVSDDLGFSSSDLESFVLASLLSLKQLGLSSDVVLPTVESAVLATLWSLLEAFATKELAEEE